WLARRGGWGSGRVGGGGGPADVLVADGAAEHRGTGAALGRFDRLTADHRALDICEDLAVGFALVVVRVHVYDEKILVVALARLPRGMLEVLRGRIVLGGELAHFAAGHVHGRLLLGVTPLVPFLNADEDIVPRRTTSNFFNRSRRSPTHSPVCSSYS